ncbi:hypothetical protein AAV35_004385 [Salimicrobium jeotgali]|uniref:Uncharacterized protein n=1 Tax=Salimicrobium jeotgali TaxID=1230341 RepID=K2GA63_9BACI|nr:hypothetical protein AAV35_004385 [Salimicrobium jeotgali]EKE31222.1 hypothetical protein MJ3_09638 [Salimicrobium jeotgali]MBM7697217.1 hypothetical protein [Salimicrobium jeotgali]
MIDESQGPRDRPGVVVVVVYHLRFGWGGKRKKKAPSIYVQMQGRVEPYLSVQEGEKKEVVWRWSVISNSFSKEQKG